MGVSIFNTGYDLQDQIDAAESAIAIVSIGDTHVAITSGQYVYVREHGTLAEGLYRATANIAANGTLSGSNVTAVSGGGLNALNSKIIPQTIGLKSDFSITSTSITSDDLIRQLDAGCYIVSSSNNINYFPFRYGTLVIFKTAGGYGFALGISTEVKDGHYMFVRHFHNNGWHTNNWIAI